jgi:hypothetical protein
MMIKAKPMYGIFHDDQTNSLYPIETAQSLLKLLTVICILFSQLIYKINHKLHGSRETLME